MKINISSHSSFLKFNKKIKEKIIKCIDYILSQEADKGSKLFRRFLKEAGFNNIQINFLFVDDEEMIQYNGKYFNRHFPTDVIAFSMIEGETIKKNNIMGDAVISVMSAERNFKDYNHTLEEELFFLITHAVLHLTGYDHNNEKGIMRQKEKKYFDYIKKNIL